MISIQSNYASLHASRQVGASDRAISQSLERLATGKRINRGADDPSGLIAATDLEGQERSLQMRIQATEQQAADYGAKEGGLSVLSDLLGELNGLVVTAANRGALSSEERSSLQIQADSILGAIDHEARTARFKGVEILRDNETHLLGTDDAGGSIAALRTGGTFNLIDGDLEAAQKAVKGAVDQVSTKRATVGAGLKQNDSQLRQLQIELENVSTAKGLILDTDYASETSRLVREQVKRDAAIFVQNFAQQARAKAVLSLLTPLK
ncbi:MAG: flagellin [Phycisphaerales bacterium]